MWGTAAGAAALVAILSTNMGMTSQEAQNLVSSQPSVAQQMAEDILSRQNNPANAAVPATFYANEPVNSPSLVTQKDPQQTVKDKVTQSPKQESDKVREKDRDPQKSAKGGVSVESLMPFVAKWENNPSNTHFAYPDGGSKSIGYGFYLGNSNSQSLLESVGANFDRVFNGEEGISEAQAKQLLRIRIEDAVKDARSIVSNFDQHPAEVQQVLADMAYNLGSRLGQFKKTIAALERFDYETAADEMYNSRWRSQVGRRAEHHINLVRSFANQNS